MENNFFEILISDALAIAALLLVLALCFRIKDITLKITFFIFIYPLIHLLYLKNGGEGSRIVGVTGLRYYSQYLGQAYWTYFFSCIAFYFSLGRARTAIHSIKAEIKVNNLTFWFVFALFVGVTILAHPWVFGLSGRREQIFLSGAWNALYVSTFLILCMLRVKNNKKYNLICISIVPIFLMLSGERVNSVLMLAAVYLFYVRGPGDVKVTDDLKVVSENKLAIYSALIIAVGAALLAGQVRELTYSSEVESFGLFKIFNYTTTIEALHVYLASFWYVDTFGYQYKPLAGALYSFIPLHPLGGAESPYFFEKIILDKIQTVGGGIFISEGVLIAGPVGAVTMSSIFGFVLRRTFLSRNKWLGMVYMLIFVLAFRVVWYGWEYVLPSLYTLFVSIALLKFAGRLK